MSDRSSEKYDIAVIGAGASGMMAAITSAGLGAKTIILEGTSRAGNKLLKTGNGRCNLTHEPVSAGVYRSKGASDADVNAYVQKALDRFGADDARAFFEELGLLTRVRDGYVYPYSEAASDVLDVLRYAVRNVGVRVIYDAAVKRIDSAGDMFMLQYPNGTVYAHKVILCTGGAADPKSGSDGSGVRIARNMGLKVNPVLPALVKLRTDDRYSTIAAGVRAKGKVWIESPYDGICGDYGEIQFTKDGLSGIPVFNISRYISVMLEKGEQVILHADLMPELGSKELAAVINKKLISIPPNQDGSVITAAELMTGLVHRKISAYIFKRMGLKPDTFADRITDEEIGSYCLNVKDLCFRVIQTYGFEEAQVTCGGVDLSEIDENMQSVKVPGLYLAGEVLDIDGPCGGYNLQWAWTSGNIAGSSAAKQ